MFDLQNDGNQRIKEFAKWLRGEMDKKGITPVELSEKAKIKNSTIYRNLNGETRPSPETLEKISHVLSIPVNELYVRAGYPFSNEPNAKKHEKQLTKTEEDFLVLARHAEDIPDEDKEKLKNTIADTIDLYLSRINKK